MYSDQFGHENVAKFLLLSNIIRNWFHFVLEIRYQNKTSSFVLVQAEESSFI